MKANLTSQTVSGLFWKSLNVFLQLALRTLVLIVLARLLTVEDFGIVNASLVVVGFTDLVAQIGVGPAIVQRDFLSIRHIRVGFSTTVVMGILMALILVVSAPVFSIFFRMEELTDILRVISLSFIFSSFGVVAESLMWRKLEFRKLLFVGIGSYVFGYALIGISLAAMGYGVWALVAAVLGQSFAKSVFSLIKAPHSIIPLYSREEFRELVKFGAGFTIGRVFNYAAGQGDYIIVGRVLGPVALGLYGRAYQLMVMPAQTIGEVLDRVLFPAISKIKDRSTTGLKNIYFRGVAVVSLVTAPLSVFFFIYSREMVLVVLGSNWIEAIPPLKILSLAVLFRTSYKISDSLAHATGAVYSRSLRQAIYASVVVLGALVGSAWGLIGVSFGVLFAILSVYILMAQMSLQIIKSTWKEFIKQQGNGFVIALILLLINYPIAQISRSIGLSSLLILMISLSFNLLFFTFLIVLFPNIIGIHGRWAVSIIIRYLPWKNSITKRIEMRFGLLG